MSFLNELEQSMVKKDTPPVRDDVVYGEVVFMQDDEATEALEAIEASGPEAAIEYLSDWDYGDYSEVVNDYRERIGKSDKVFEGDQYVLAWNPGVGYVSLYAKLPADQYGD